MSTVRVELPEELFKLVNVPDAQPSRSVIKLIVLELFREHRISLGKAAELAEVPVEEFMLFADERDVPVHYTLADWETDQVTTRDLNP